MHDLLYKDLGTVDGNLHLDLDFNADGLDMGGWNGIGNSTVGNSTGVVGGVASGNGPGEFGGGYQFEGDFGNDSFWGFMNNYHP